MSNLMRSSIYKSLRYCRPNGANILVMYNLYHNFVPNGTYLAPGERHYGNNQSLTKFKSAVGTKVLNALFFARLVVIFYNNFYPVINGGCVLYSLTGPNWLYIAER